MHSRRSAASRLVTYVNQYSPECPAVDIAFALLIGGILWVAAWLISNLVCGLCASLADALGFETLALWIDRLPFLLPTVVAVVAVYLHGFERGVTGHRKHLALPLEEAQDIYEAAEWRTRPHIERQFEKAMRAALERLREE